MIKGKPRRSVLLRKLALKIDPDHEASLGKSFLILKRAHESAHAILKAFDLVYSTTRTQGAPTDEEQDLLRAMLVLAAAGLDSMTKQVIRDNLLALATFDVKVMEELEKFVARRLRDDLQDGSTKRSRDFLAKILVAPSMRSSLINEHISELTSGSLQSAAELVRVGNAIGITSTDVRFSPETLQVIFKIRNQIIHELDIDFSNPRRTRRSRVRDLMIQHTNSLLEIAEAILRTIQNKLKPLPSDKNRP